ncbi:hypothetical protein [Streptomyces sp. NPDC050264]
MGSGPLELKVKARELAATPDTTSTVVTLTVSGASRCSVTACCGN